MALEAKPVGPVRGLEPRRLLPRVAVLAGEIVILADRRRRSPEPAPGRDTHPPPMGAPPGRVPSSGNDHGGRPAHDRTRELAPTRRGARRHRSRGAPVQRHLVRREDETESLAYFWVRFDGEPTPFETGQYMTIGVMVDGKIVQRPYSVASPPAVVGTDGYEFYVRLVQGGTFTPLLWDLPSATRCG